MQTIITGSIAVPILTELTPQQLILIKLLESIKLSEIREGSVTIHIGNGQIQKIEKKEFYKP